MDTLFTTFDTFETERMVKTSLDTKQSKPRADPNNPSAPPQSVTYQVTSLQYEYDVKDEKTGQVTKNVAPLAVEAPELFSPMGIATKFNSNGYEAASLFTIFDFRKGEVKNFCSLGESHTGMAAGFWQQLYSWCLNRIWELRSQIPTVQRLPAKEALLGMFAYPIYFSRDPSTGDVVSGSNPSKYFNLLCRGKPGSAMRKETLFKAPIVTGEVGGKKQFQTIPWDLLKNVEMVFKPVITFKQLYIGGGKVSLQFEITSAVVKSATPINSTSAQKESLNEYAADASVAAAITEQIALLSRRLNESDGDGTTTLPMPTPAPTKDEQKDQLADLSAPASLPVAQVAPVSGHVLGSSPPQQAPAQATPAIQTPSPQQAAPQQAPTLVAAVGSTPSQQAAPAFNIAGGGAPSLTSVLGSAPQLTPAPQ